MLSVSMKTTDKFTIKVSPINDATGLPGDTDGPPTYPVDTTGFVTLTPTADGLSCEVKALSPGTCNITPTATAKGVTITGAIVQVTIAPAENFATRLDVSVTPVVPQ